MRVLMTGSSGRLGMVMMDTLSRSRTVTYFTQNNQIFTIPYTSKLFCPSSKELDITDVNSCYSVVSYLKPTVIIHAAGYVSTEGAEKEREKAWELNVTGTRNMLQAADGIRFVYISTDYVFDSNINPRKETDPPNPLNFYGLTKLCGEQVTLTYPNTLVLRAPFRYQPWPYDNAFTDQFTSCAPVTHRAKQILYAALQPEWSGILHIGSFTTLSIFALAKTFKPDVKPSTLAQYHKDHPNIRIPHSVILDSSKWMKLLRESNQSGHSLTGMGT